MVPNKKQLLAESGYEHKDPQINLTSLQSQIKSLCVKCILALKCIYAEIYIKRKESKQFGLISNRGVNQQGSGNMILYKDVGHNLILFQCVSPLLLFHLHWTSVIIFLAHSVQGYWSNKK